MTRCAECGASYVDAGDSCAVRFDRLLALDHSRQPPWGHRHGQAFAAFALEHPTRHQASLDHAWMALNRIYLCGEHPNRVFGSLRPVLERLGRGTVEPQPRTRGGVAPRPAEPVAAPAITIADLGDFDAGTYAERLDEWCRAALAMWGADTSVRLASPRGLAR
jgi:Family of unknown function (DUF5946)